ncbi:MAG: cell division protein FtsI [Selenomonas sp.]|uniref:peptidoglycan D,D-transpeptidase FtsI family protein n=1 Tax=Selenomonas sp. TaxID=2053611 RepID=UPI0025F6FA93|nr:penicillin-binding transpeptidase domain-containing protein [Selenomonas sp.]MCR5758548.1 cell division protein FtsI [Selenomonas sp.]
MSDWKLKRQILQVAAFLLIMVAVLSLYIGYLAVWEGQELAENPLNMRGAAAKADIRRGTIYDAHGRVLAQTQDDGTRSYPLGEVMAHITGYNGENIGSAGLEGHANRELLGLTADMSKLGPLAQLLQTDKGNDIKTTIEADAQQAAYDGLNGRKGAVVVLDADTGAVLAMVSSPSYDPNNVEANWKTLSQEVGGPLLNRAVQGLYPPGSSIKPMIADAALTEGVTNEQEVFDCPGVLDVGGGHTIQESHGAVHNRLDLRKALTVSCNVTFGTLGMRLGDDKLHKSFTRFGFDRSIGGEIVMTSAHLPDFGNLGTGDQAQTAIGQSTLLVTPMHMAMLAAAFAHGGKVMKPYLVQDVITPGGLVVHGASPEKWLTVTTESMAAKIYSYMEDVVTKGTGKAAQVSGVEVAGKTGTAENPQGEDHAWFIGSAKLRNRNIAFAIIVENGGGGGTEAAPIARKIILSLQN